MIKKPIKINDAMIKWYQYKWSEHNKLEKVKKRENPNESRPLAVLFSPQPRSVDADFASMRNTDKASQAS